MEKRKKFTTAKVIVLALFLIFHKNIFSMENQEGFLALSVSPHYIQSLGTGDLRIQLDGVSYNREIQTTFLLLDKPFHIQAIHQRDDLGEIFPFSWFFWSQQYQVYRRKSFFFSTGFELGHSGYRISGQEPTATSAYATLPISLNYLLNKYFLLNHQILLPIAYYKKDMNSLFQTDNRTEIQFDPYRSILNPSPDTALYSLILETKYISLKTSTGTYKKTLLQLYAKISLLY